MKHPILHENIARLRALLKDAREVCHCGEYVDAHTLSDNHCAVPMQTQESQTLADAAVDALPVLLDLAEAALLGADRDASATAKVQELCEQIGRIQQADYATETVDLLEGLDRIGKAVTEMFNRDSNHNDQVGSLHFRIYELTQENARLQKSLEQATTRQCFVDMVSAQAEADKFRACLELIASPAGFEGPMWATYHARKALGSKSVPVIEALMDAQVDKRFTLQGQLDEVRDRLANLVRVVEKLDVIPHRDEGFMCRSFFGCKCDCGADDRQKALTQAIQIARKGLK